MPGLLQDPLLGRSGALTIDGSARGNPGPASIAFILEEKGAEAIERARRIGEATNNTAEYTALIEGLEEALARGVEELVVRTDSQLLARQLTGEYRIRKKHLMALASRAHALLRRFESWDVEHIPREKNKRADSLCKRAFRCRKSSR